MNSNLLALACFDIDGTIHRKGLFNLLVWALIEQKVVPDTLLHHPDMVAARQDWERRRISHGRYSGTIVRLFFETGCLKGVSETRVQQVADQVIAEYDEHVWHFPRCLVAAIKEATVAKIVAISGSPTQVVNPFIRRWGFHAALGTELELDANGCFTSDDERSVRHYRHKDLALVSFQTQYACSPAQTLAMGNTVDDVPMLKLARWPIAMNPNQAMARMARELLFPVVMEYDDSIHFFRAKDAGGPLVQTTLDDCLPQAIIPHLRSLIADRL